jgi:hypothetical protein
MADWSKCCVSSYSFRALPTGKEYSHAASFGASGPCAVSGHICCERTRQEPRSVDIQTWTREKENLSINSARDFRSFAVLLRHDGYDL